MKNNNDLVIETYGLSKSYMNVQALKSLNLKVAQHSIFGLVGSAGGFSGHDGGAFPDHHPTLPPRVIPWKNNGKL